MHALRHIPLPIHSALEFLVGLAVAVAPFALGLSTAAAFAGVIVGVLVAGLALQSLGDDLHIRAHLAGDQGIALGLAAAGAALGFAGDGRAAVLFTAFAGLQLLLILATRYTAR